MRTLIFLWKTLPECIGMLREVLRGGRVPPSPYARAHMRWNFIRALERRAQATGRTDLFEIAQALRAEWEME